MAYGQCQTKRIILYVKCSQNCNRFHKNFHCLSCFVFFPPRKASLRKNIFMICHIYEQIPQFNVTFHVFMYLASLTQLQREFLVNQENFKRLRSDGFLTMGEGTAPRHFRAPVTFSKPTCMISTLPVCHNAIMILVSWVIAT